MMRNGAALARLPGARAPCTSRSLSHGRHVGGGQLQSGLIRADCERTLCDTVRRLQQHFDIAPT
jgi:hypothetical protein